MLSIVFFLAINGSLSVKLAVRWNYYYQWDYKIKNNLLFSETFIYNFKTCWNIFLNVKTFKVIYKTEHHKAISYWWLGICWVPQPFFWKRFCYTDDTFIVWKYTDKSVCGHICLFGHFRKSWISHWKFSQLTDHKTLSFDTC